MKVEITYLGRDRYLVQVGSLRFLTDPVLHTNIPRLQEFRLNELISLSGAEGGAIFLVRDSLCNVLFHGATIRRCVNSIGGEYPSGLI